MPPFAKYFRNCYTLPSQFFIIGTREIQSAEWSTQGDPTAMAIYAIALIPLILVIVDTTRQDDSFTKTAAYADDFEAVVTVIGSIEYKRTYIQEIISGLKNYK